MTESGVCLIKKKVATLKTELDECQIRASEAEDNLSEKETVIEKVNCNYKLNLKYCLLLCISINCAVFLFCMYAVWRHYSNLMYYKILFVNNKSKNL